MKVYAIVIVFVGYVLLSLGMAILDKKAVDTCEQKQELQRAIDPHSVNDGECDQLLIK